MSGNNKKTASTAGLPEEAEYKSYVKTKGGSNPITLNKGVTLAKALQDASRKLEAAGLLLKLVQTSHLVRGSNNPSHAILLHRIEDQFGPEMRKWLESCCACRLDQLGMIVALPELIIFPE